MKNKGKIVGLCAVAGVWAALSIINLVKSPAEYSLSERRKLAQMPPLKLETVASGKFMSDFESYATDQFPFREELRTLKAMTSLYGFQKKDNNGIYISDGYAAKLEYPLNEASVKSGAEKLTALYERYVRDKTDNVYLSIVPDKGYFLAEKNGYPHMDYALLVETVTGKMDFAEYVDLFPLLSLEDYYKTDTHWKQENLTDVAETLCEAMGTSPLSNPVVSQFDTPFYGVYYGQAALPMKPDTLSYITSDVLENCTVTNLENGKTYTGVWDTEELSGADPYEVFLSGAAAIVTIDNPNGSAEKELVIFRDSFGSSLAPLLSEGYGKITLVDTRYIMPDYVGQFMNFESADVLFLYSTLILNQSEALQK